MESISTRNVESKEDEQQHPKPHKPICGNRMYLSHPENKAYIYQQPSPLFNTVKSSETNSNFKDTNYSINNVKDSVNHNIMDSCTQTSKTILQLAKTEIGCLTPDSLMQSPRNPEYSNRDNHLNLRQLQSKLQSCSINPGTNLSCCTLEGSVREQEASVSYVRKNNLRQYLDSCEVSASIPSKEEITVYPKKSLTETFLTKKKIDGKGDLNNCRSTFLQQTSPLRNLNIESPRSNLDYFKSQSYIEQPDPPSVQNYKCQKKVPFQISRFTVKGIKEQQPLKCHWNFTEANATNISHGNRDKLSSGATNYDQSLFNNCDVPTLHHSPTYSPRRKYRSPNHPSTFMSPTISSEQKSQSHKVQELKTLISPTRRGRSVSPPRTPTIPNRTENEIKKCATRKIPYIDQSHSQLTLTQPERHKGGQIRKSISYRQGSPKSLIATLNTRPKFDEDLLKLDLESLDIKLSDDMVSEKTEPSRTSSVMSSENTIMSMLNRIKDHDWNIALKGIAEMTELCRIMDSDLIFPHMTTVNQRLLELLRSPRSHVCRTACQAAGHFFESMKDTRRPEFDDIVENLLCKTADANKFIRKDANLSLDCMVTHIPIYHSVRSLCLKGPLHKNALVRTATIRLIVCAIVIAGPDIILNLPSHEPTRKRIILHLAKFLADKNLETRKYGERLYKILCKESSFDSCLKKYLEKKDINEMKIFLKCKNQKR